MDLHPPHTQGGRSSLIAFPIKLSLLAQGHFRTRFWLGEKHIPRKAIAEDGRDPRKGQLEVRAVTSQHSKSVHGASPPVP